MFILQFLQYALASLGYLALAAYSYTGTFLMDLILAANSFYIVKRISQCESRAGQVGYTLGGACGSCVAIWISKHFFGH